MEIIVAISVLSIGILSVMVLQTSSVQRNSNARGITEASTWATDEMEYRMTLGYQHAYLQDDSTDDKYIIDADCCPNHPAVLAGYTINTDIRDSAYLTKTITVNVSWSNFGSFGKEKTVSIESIRAQLRDK